MRKAVTALMIVNTLISVTSLTIAVTLYLSMPKIATFDMKNTTDMFLKQVSRLNLPEQEQQALMKKYEKNMNAIAREKYAQDNTIIFVSGAVISNIHDDTKNIKALLAKKMNGDQDE